MHFADIMHPHIFIWHKGALQELCFLAILLSLYLLLLVLRVLSVFEELLVLLSTVKSLQASGNPNWGFKVLWDAHHCPFVSFLGKIAIWIQISDLLSPSPTPSSLHGTSSLKTERKRLQYLLPVVYVPTQTRYNGWGHMLEFLITTSVLGIKLIFYFSRFRSLLGSVVGSAKFHSRIEGAWIPSSSPAFYVMHEPVLTYYLHLYSVSFLSLPSKASVHRFLIHLLLTSISSRRHAIR